MTSEYAANSGSFRDPDNRVYEFSSKSEDSQIRILRGLSEGALTIYQRLLDEKFYQRLVEKKAVVATTVEGVVEVVDDGITGYLVPPRSPRPLATKIIELLLDERLRLEMGVRGRQKTLNQFSIEILIAKTKAIYENLLHSEPRVLAH